MKEKDSMFDMINTIDLQRKYRGFLTIKELINLTEIGNVILDPFSTLISAGVKIGEGNIFYPSVTIELANNGSISIGNENRFYSQTYIFAGPGEIIIGSNNQFGDGGISIKANQDKVRMTIGDGGRYVNQVLVLGNTHLGSGSQILGGPITVQDCQVGEGRIYTYEDPDERGGVVKGFGIARNLLIRKGEVINGLGSFNQNMIQKQSYYHPKSK